MQRAQRPWGSGNTTPTGDAPEFSPGAGPDVPGGWPMFQREELGRHGVGEGNADGGLAERVTERIAHGRRATDRPGS